MLPLKIRSVVSGIALICAWAVTGVSPASGQQSSIPTWKVYTQTFTRLEPVTEYRWEEKEVMETSYKKKMVPVYQTETVEEKSISYRPVKKTREHVERYKELEPVTVTKYRERAVQETSYDTVTEMREEQYVTRRPVTETVMQDKQFNVRQKVTETGYRYQDVTTYKPTSVAETTLVPTNVLVPSTIPVARPQVQWLRPGYYSDPATGLTAWRRRGLHWTLPRAPAATVVPAVVPQTTARLAYVPQVSRKAEPVEISRYVDRVETRKVPVEVNRIEERLETRKVPVEVRRPRQVTRVEKIPYRETTYREVERVRKIPVIEETMQKVETIKPVEKTTAKWVEKREAIETPKIVRRKVAFTTTKKVPYTVKMRQRIDSYGNSIGDPEPVDPEWQAWFKARQEQGQPVSLKPASDGASISINSVLEKEQADTDPTFQPRHPVPEADTVPTLKEKPTSPTSVTPIAPPSARDNRVRSILVPETRGDFTASTNMRKLGGPSLMIETSTDSREASKRVPGATAVPTNSTGGVANTDPVSAIPRSDGKTETSLNSAWKVFDPELIKPPTVPTSGTVPKSGDDLSVDDLDRVECPQRQPVKDIY